MKINRMWIIISGILGFLGVAIGAFGAHSLKAYMAPDMVEIYKTGVMYHLIHTAVITAIALSGIERFFTAAWFFTFGIVLFSFSLYIYSLSGAVWVAVITPFGGISFLIGWVLLIVYAVRLPQVPKL